MAGQDLRLCDPGGGWTLEEAARATEAQWWDYYWCDHCHWGARTGRAEIPAAADMLPFSAPDEVLKARIPQFRETTYWLE